MAEPAAMTELPNEYVSDNLKCRFYQNEYPEPDDLVFVKVTNVGDMGAYVQLLEYNNKEGLVLLPEIGRRRIRAKSTRLKVNRFEVVRVIRVDKEKGYIDLSKRLITPEDAAQCEVRYYKARMVHSVLSHVAKSNDMRLEDLCAKVGWPLYAKFGHAYDAFQIALESDAEEYVDVFADLDVTPLIKKKLLKHMKRRLLTHVVEPVAHAYIIYTAEAREIPSDHVAIEADAPAAAESSEAVEEPAAQDQDSVEVWQFLPDCEHSELCCQ